MLSGVEYESYAQEHMDDVDFVAGSGAEVIKTLLGMIDLKFELAVMQGEYHKTMSAVVRHKLMRRMKFFLDYRAVGCNHQQ